MDANATLIRQVAQGIEQDLYRGQGGNRFERWAVQENAAREL